MSKGFLTVATGDEHYYKLAANLLRSYRLHTKKTLPFAILADRENAYTKQFDQTILLPAPTNSYLDKLRLYEFSPFEECVFIDADCLAYGDLNGMFDWFAGADDVSCHGRVLPLTDKTGWFNYEDLGDLKDKITYCVGLHGGIYFIRKTPKAAAVFETAKLLVKDYEMFHFKGKFQTPGDEPLMALSMALHDCRPIPFVTEGICCYWEQGRVLALDIRKGKAVNRTTGQRTILVHWGTRFTRRLRYRLQAALLSFGKRKKYA